VDAAWICPSCGQPETLIALGARRDYPHRWRWWVSTLTQLYLCDQCDALVALDAAQIPIVESTPGRSDLPGHGQRPHRSAA
jgi:hypothetical protein